MSCIRLAKSWHDIDTGGNFRPGSAVQALRPLCPTMQRIASLAAFRELGGLAARSPSSRAWRKGSPCSEGPAVQRQWASWCVCPKRPFSWAYRAEGQRLCRQRFVFAPQNNSAFCSQPGADGPRGDSDQQPFISVVGIPDPITWIRCKVTMYLIKLCFGVDTDCVEFNEGVKQALVHVSNLMSGGKYHRLVGIVSPEMIEHIEKKCRSLTDDQRRQLAVAMDDIVFMLPEDVSAVFDQYGRKFCFITMRFWLLTADTGPDDPEGTKLFKVTNKKEGHPQRKIVTAVYEFQRELTNGASPDWTVTIVWHWQWKSAE